MADRDDAQQEHQLASVHAAQKRCRACKALMPIDANKCTACSGLQDWRRYLSGSSVVLSLLVALTSVLAFAIPIWKEAIVPKVARASAALVEVDATGLATVVMTNSGNPPAVLEHILLGAENAVVKFNFESLTPDERVVRPNGINVISSRLDIENTVDGVWPLVSIYRDTGSCHMLVTIISPDGNRTTAVADASTAEHEDSGGSNTCVVKLKKLSVATLNHLGNTPEYVPTLCKVAELHPRDPENLQTGSGC